VLALLAAHVVHQMLASWVAAVCAAPRQIDMGYSPVRAGREQDLECKLGCLTKALVLCETSERSIKLALAVRRSNWSGFA